MTWPKQGHTLLFLWNESGRSFLDLYAYDPAAKKRVRLTNLEGAPDAWTETGAEKDELRKKYPEPPAGLAGFDVSADGRRAAFSYRGELYRVGTDGTSAPARLTRTRAAESSPRLSPSGDALAFVRDGQVFILDQTVVGGRLTQVTLIEEGSLETYAWSPDGAKIAYTVQTGKPRKMPLPNYSGRLVKAAEFDRSVSGDEPLEHKHFVVDAQGGKPVSLEGDGKVWWNDAPKWSPDSRRLVLSIVHAKFKRRQILVFDAATGKSRVVFDETDVKWVENDFAGWSPDSRTVFFTSERDG
ncbi:MAG: DPP IV N-terminal domain-containing protein, partial [Bryobacteraceae bacterium]